VDAAARHLDVSGSRVADGGRGEGADDPVPDAPFDTAAHRAAREQAWADERAGAPSP